MLTYDKYLDSLGEIEPEQDLCSECGGPLEQHPAGRRCMTEDELTAAYVEPRLTADEADRRADATMKHCGPFDADVSF